MSEKQQQRKEKTRMNGEKKFYLFTAIGCAAVLLAIIVVAAALTNAGKVETPSVNNGASSSVPDSSSGGGTAETPPDVNQPVGGTTEGMTLPMASASVLNDYGFYHNKTLNHYYEHKGVDFASTAGSEVKAVKGGTVESIYKADVLLGTEITIDHGDGLKTVYRFVEEKEGLQVGDSVEQGEVIATVAEATGNEYKDGAHLHFEVIENGEQVDPTLHLTLEEK